MVSRSILVTLICLLASMTLHAATLAAEVDRKELRTDEHVLFTLSLSESDTRLRAEGISPNVDLSVLTRDFELGEPRAGNRFNIFRNRGRSTSDIQVLLFPKHAGKLVIPSFTVDGMQTAPISLQVHELPPDAIPQAFARSGVSKNKLWVREQAIVYLDVYYRVAIESAQLGGDIDTQPKQLDLVKLPPSERSEIVDGVSYNVSRTAWAITPLSSAPLTLYLPDVWIETKDGQKLRLPLSEQQITVKALPDSVPPLAIIGKPDLVQSELIQTAEVNQVIPWEITLRAPTTAKALPERLPVTDLPPQLKLYLDSTSRDIDTSHGDVTSVARYHAYIIALSPGDFSLPDIVIPYFDTTRGVLDALSFAGQPLHIEPPAAGMTTTDRQAVMRPPVSAVPDNPNNSLRWQFVSLILLLLWLMTLALWWHQRRTTRDAPAPASAPTISTHPDQHPLNQRLLAAFGSHTLEQGLRQWEQLHGEDTGLRNTVLQLQRLCYGNAKDIDEATLEQAIETAVKKIREKANHPATNKGVIEPWSPYAFTPRLAASRSENTHEQP